MANPVSMPTRAFSAFQPALRGLLGGAEIQLQTLKSLKKVGREQNNRSYTKNIMLDGKNYRFQAFRPHFKFTATEKSFCNQLLEAFQQMYNKCEHRGHSAHFRTAFMASLLDITVARFLRGPKQKAFGAIQRIIQTLKNLSFQRYEGSPATTGLVIHREDVKDFSQKLEQSKHAFQHLDTTEKMDVDFFDNPLTHRFVNGANMLYSCNFKGRVKGIVSLKFSRHYDAVERLSHQPALSLLKSASQGAFAAFVNNLSEIEIVLSNGVMLFWRRGTWFIFDPEIFAGFLGMSQNEKPFLDLVSTVYALSRTRHGTVILINDGSDLSDFWFTSTAVGSALAKAVIHRVKNKRVGELRRSGQLMGILSSDGLTVIDRTGRLVDTGVIVKTKPRKGDRTGQRQKAGGGRTAAARVASIYGPVIKVSEDGPIDLFSNGTSIYCIG